MEWHRTTEKAPPTDLKEELLGAFTLDGDTLVYATFWFEPHLGGFATSISRSGDPEICEAPVFWSRIDPHPPV